MYSYDALARLQEAALRKSRQDTLSSTNVPAQPAMIIGWPIAIDRRASLPRLIAMQRRVLAETMIKAAQSPEDDKSEVAEIGRFIRLGPLGTAFLDSKLKKPRVVLIDEIDKSDIDLPNDLLHLFEEGEFEIQEIARLPQGKTDNATSVEVFAHDKQENKLKKLSVPRDGLMRCEAFPLVIMTSNGEREFPPAFLRRCLPLRLEQPGTEKLQKIVAKHLGLEVPDPEENLEKEEENNLTEAQREARSILKDFLTIQRDEHKKIATDQLLNAIYLIKAGTNLSD